jgi:hypothetical protein
MLSKFISTLAHALGLYTPLDLQNACKNLYTEDELDRANHAAYINGKKDTEYRFYRSNIRK